MTELNERVETIEKTIADLSLDLQASRIAITVLTSVINKMNGDPGYVTTLYEEEKVRHLWLSLTTLSRMVMRKNSRKKCWI
ncbi:hypothetical protein OFY05_06440 [Pseudocitrobacter faecalis]|nr:hypothetical protein OFY05_06440 [Pseudocitrobacter faecalis]